MALRYAIGRNLANNDPATGRPGAVTGGGVQNSDANVQTVIVRGPVGALESYVPLKGAGHATCPWVPDGFFVNTATLSISQGEATITITCIAPGTDTQQSPLAPVTIQYQILMSEVQMDLVTHPDITANANALDECLKWLATDESQRFDGTDYYWVDAEGTKQPVNQEEAIRFCAAWMHGIHTYNVYYPIIEKQSTYTRVPGLSLSGMNVTGGTAKFSPDIGKFSPPDISLQGYASTGWYKSGDDYRSAGRVFTRSEQWTWTPDGSDSAYAWIYGGSGEAAT
jgi:hypothetical protein